MICVLFDLLSFVKLQSVCEVAYIMLCLNYTLYNFLLMLHHIITLLIQYFVKPIARLYVLHTYYAHHMIVSWMVHIIAIIILILIAKVIIG